LQKTDGESMRQRNKNAERLLPPEGAAEVKAPVPGAARRRSAASRDGNRTS